MDALAIHLFNLLKAEMLVDVLLLDFNLDFLDSASVRTYLTMDALLDSSNVRSYLAMTALVIRLFNVLIVTMLVDVLVLDVNLDCLDSASMRTFLTVASLAIHLFNLLNIIMLDDVLVLGFNLDFLDSASVRTYLTKTALPIHLLNLRNVIMLVNVHALVFKLDSLGSASLPVLGYSVKYAGGWNTATLPVYWHATQDVRDRHAFQHALLIWTCGFDMNESALYNHLHPRSARHRGKLT